MPTHATTPQWQNPQWQNDVEAVCADVGRLCDHLLDAPLEERLHALDLLDTSFRTLHDGALRAAVVDARGAGWALRRIAGSAGRSHEQIRILTRPAG